MVEPTRAGWAVALLATSCTGRAPEDRVARAPDPPRAANAAPVPIRNAPGAAMTDPELDDHIGALYDEHPQDFGPAIQWLVAHPERARPALRAIAAERKADLGTARALLTLGRIGDVADVELLAAALREARTHSQTWDAAKALGAHSTPEAAAALIAALASQQPEVAGAAATLLGERKEENARAGLESLLEHPHAGTRYRAVRALGALGAAGSAAALARRARIETDPDVKEALRALGHR